MEFSTPLETEISLLAKIYEIVLESPIENKEWPNNLAKIFSYAQCSTRKIFDCEPESNFAKIVTVVTGHIAATIFCGLIALIVLIKGLREKRILLQSRSITLIFCGINMIVVKQFLLILENIF